MQRRRTAAASTATTASDVCMNSSPFNSGFMKWRALATDFDGTFAREGEVSPSTLAAARRLRDHGSSLLLVTGRELRDFASLGTDLSLFDLVVAENGAVMLDPKTATQTILAPVPDPHLVERLQQRGVEPLSVGQTIIATTEPNEMHVLECIRDLGLELTITFNKGWVMILPPAVNKATGLAAALDRLDIPASEVVAVGDAENDHAFLNHCGYAVAVANALPALKEKAHFVTEGAAGDGVAELIDLLIADKLQQPTLPHPGE